MLAILIFIGKNYLKIASAMQLTLTAKDNNNR